MKAQVSEQNGTLRSRLGGLKMQHQICKKKTTKLLYYLNVERA